MYLHGYYWCKDLKNGINVVGLLKTQSGLGQGARLLLEAISGYDPNDSTSINTPVPNYAKNLDPNIKGLKIGIIKELMGEGLQAEVRENVEKAIQKYKELGAEIYELSLLLHHVRKE